MSKAPAATVTQVRRLCESLRALPADDAARALEQIVTIAQAVQAGILAEAQRAGELKDSGCRSVRGYAASILRRSVGDASMVAQVALRLADFPKLAEVYRDGRAHTGNLRAVTDAISSCGLDVLQAHEAALVDLALRAGPGEIKQFCQMLADLNHPDRDRKKVRAAGGRMVRLARVGDLMHLDAMLDPALGAQLKATLTAMAKAAYAAERAAVREAEQQAQKQADPARANGTGPGSDGGGGPDPWGRDRPVTDPRTHGERVADALEQILRAGMNTSEVPTSGRARPHASVSVQLETLLGLGTGRAADLRGAGQAGPAGQALLHRFGLIGTDTAARLCCDALVRLVVKHGDRVLNVGRRHRVVTARQHAVLAQRHTTCVVPGCRIPFGDCDVHHLWWWSLGGRTDLDLQLPLCSSHHIWLHEGGYSIVREDGRLVFRDPHGRVIPDTTSILTDQLDLLHQTHAHDPQTTATTRPALADHGWASIPAALTDPVGRAGPADDGCATGGGRHDDEAAQATQAAQAHLDERAAFPYDHGTWGWNGPNPSPPPGHAPPQPVGS